MRLTEAECRNRPGFKTREEWSGDLARRLEKSATS